MLRPGVRSRSWPAETPSPSSEHGSEAGFGGAARARAVLLAPVALALSLVKGVYAAVTFVPRTVSFALLWYVRCARSGAGARPGP